MFNKTLTTLMLTALLGAMAPATWAEKPHAVAVQKKQVAARPAEAKWNRGDVEQLAKYIEDRTDRLWDLVHKADRDTRAAKEAFEMVRVFERETDAFYEKADKADEQANRLRPDYNALRQDFRRMGKTFAYLRAHGETERVYRDVAEAMDKLDRLMLGNVKSDHEPVRGHGYLSNRGQVRDD